MSEKARSYDDACGVARALDAVGERWALLVVRELLFGAKRFSDLRRGLGGVSPNVLSQRLAQLERDGILHQRVAGPPVGTNVYELTPSGRELAPVLDALARWGRHRPIRSDRPLSRDALMLALQTTVREGTTLAAGLRVTLDGSSWDPVVADGALHWRLPAEVVPASTLVTSAATLHRLVFRGLGLDEAEATSQAAVEGDRAVVVAFLGSFERPTASTTAPVRDTPPT